MKTLPSEKEDYVCTTNNETNEVDVVLNDDDRSGECLTQCNDEFNAECNDIHP